VTARRAVALHDPTVCEAEDAVEGVQPSRVVRDSPRAITPPLQQWSVAFDAAVLIERAVLPDNKTAVRTIWLGAAARPALSGLPKAAKFRTLPGRRVVHVPALDAASRQVRATIGFPGLRRRDPRHASASVSVTSGEQLWTVSGLLSHIEMTTCSD